MTAERWGAAFDPDRLALLELRMWKAYYRRQPARLALRCIDRDFTQPINIENARGFGVMRWRFGFGWSLGRHGLVASGFDYLRILSALRRCRCSHG